MASDSKGEEKRRMEVERGAYGEVALSRGGLVEREMVEWSCVREGEEQRGGETSVEVRCYPCDVMAVALVSAARRAQARARLQPWTSVIKCHAVVRTIKPAACVLHANYTNYTNVSRSHLAEIYCPSLVHEKLLGQHAQQVALNHHRYFVF